jgi:hypothetical protein
VLARPIERREIVVDLARRGSFPFGSAGGPANGALISTTDWKTSGRISAHHAETGEPKSWPMTAATDE